MNLKESRKKLLAARKKLLGTNDAVKGLSIVIPVSDGIDYLERCLKNLKNQVISKAKFEVILVFNGSFMNEISYVYKNMELYEELDLMILINDTKGAGPARNLGVKYSKYSHIVFLDIDDYFSKNFIQKNYDYSLDEGICLSQIHDVVGDEIVEDNIINNEILLNADNNSLKYNDVNRILTITACKTIPKSFFKINEFKEYLKSGEDTVFFTELIINLRPDIIIIPIEENSIYYRQVRQNSVSRKASSFDFLVNQRIDILKILDPMLDHVGNIDLKMLLSSKYKAQISFMNRYLKENPNEHSKVISILEEQKLKHFDYRILNRDLSNTLFISYCFVPFADTSASIVVKRILEEQKVVDVVSNNMNSIRTKDFSFKKVVEPYLSQTKISNSKPSFSSFYYLSEYIDDSFEFFCKNFDKYSKVYSRAMFPVSHLPPMLMKLLKPDLYWKAEFSDPLLIDIESNERVSVINNKKLMSYIKSGVLGDFTQYIDDNLFNLAELIPFALADELVFTNENQLHFMIQRFTKDLQDKIVAKSTILRHPTVNQKYYNLIESNYNLDEEFINVAYFGNFYSRRDVKELVLLKNKLERESKNFYKFHIFTNTKLLNENQKELLLRNNIITNEYVPYFEFLNLTNKFDVLLVFDSITNDIKSLNPYLPSKISDYIGSRAIILALVENESMLDKMKHQNLFKIDIDNIDKEVFDTQNFMERALKGKEDYIKVSDNSLIFPNTNYDFIVDDSLNVEKTENGWFTRPGKSPISFEENYMTQIKNTGNETIEVNIRSQYKQKDIIDVVIVSSELERNECITNFIRSEKYKLEPDEGISFELIYNKEYKKASFLNAGKLYFNVICE